MSVREQLDAVEVYTDGNGGLAADTAIEAFRVLADGLDQVLTSHQPVTLDILEAYATAMRHEVQRALELVLGPPSPGSVSSPEDVRPIPNREK